MEEPTKISISQLKEYGPDLRKRVESEAVIYVTKHGRTLFALVDCSYLAELEGAFDEVQVQTQGLHA